MMDTPYPLSCMTAAFPSLPLPSALLFIRTMGFDEVDVQCFTGEPHITPEDVVAAPEDVATAVAAQLGDAGLSCGDVFATMPEGRHINTASPDTHRANVAATAALAAFAQLLGSTHLSLLPGIVDEAGFEDSFARSCRNLADHVHVAESAGLACSVEPHIGSVAARPEHAAALCAAVPGLGVTLDPSHFIVQGYDLNALAPLTPLATRVQIRQAHPGRVQAGAHKGTIDISAFLDLLAEAEFKGGICVEYIHKSWENCRNVDVVSETVSMRNALMGMRAQ